MRLPDYFEAINREFHYQLTCIGGFAQVYIAEEIQDNRFKIAGGRPGLKISWTVTAERNDAYQRQYRREAEQPKPDHWRGKYLHPELHGAPKESGIYYKSPPKTEATIPNGSRPNGNANSKR